MTYITGFPEKVNKRIEKKDFYVCESGGSYPRHIKYADFKYKIFCETQRRDVSVC
jgi:hypothetical protein